VKASEKNTGRNKGRVLITCGRLWSDLAITRSLGRQGYKVDVVDNIGASISRFSKYCDRFYHAPDLTESPFEYGKFVVSLVKKNRYDFVIPVFEEVFVLSRFKEEIEKHSKILINDFDTYMKLHDKGRLYEFCLESKIRAPFTVRTGPDMNI